MSDASKKYQLEDRTLQFSVRVIKHCTRIKQPSLQSITNQLIRSATSIGTNYAEANNAASKTDFRAKVFIAKKEAAETKYWLKVITGLGDNTEVQGIPMTLQKIISAPRKRSENGER